jgi:hypothetical protein
LAAVQRQLDSWAAADMVLGWLQDFGLTHARVSVAQWGVALMAAPAVVVLSLLAIAVLVTPAVVKLVTQRRFADLERKRGGSNVGSVMHALGLTTIALLLTVASMPLWFFPLMILVLPPLIWGWLAYRLMVYDVLAEHASKWERRQLIKRHRSSLWLMGIITGYLGGAPSLLWASGLVFMALAPVFIPLAIWMYMLVFAFSALWFTHFALKALKDLREETPVLTPIEEVAGRQARPGGFAATFPQTLPDTDLDRTAARPRLP